MNRIRLNEVLVVEGKYDATALASLVDGLIVTTQGFGIFSNEEQKELLRRLGKNRGLLILTDSDAAGFKIRHYIEKIADGCSIKHAYIPAIPGKEGRKRTASKEGTLGVEGLAPAVLRQALERAGAGVDVLPPRTGRAITHTDLYELGLSGGSGSATRRRVLLAGIGLPQRLSKRALVQVLNSLYSFEEFLQICADSEDTKMMNRKKQPLFWDFHGTLTLPDFNWLDAAMESAALHAPQFKLERARVSDNLSSTCLPWFTVPDGDTRHLAGEEAWWQYCEGEFVEMFVRSGLPREAATTAAPALRGLILQPERYHLYPDAISTLAELQKRGYTSYILSNNFPELPEIIRALKLGDYFAGIVTSGLVGYEKPRKEIFSAVLLLAGYFPQDGAPKPVMIGDNPVDDIQGGRAAGFETVSVHGNHTLHADRNLNHLAEMLDIFP